jgi:hypothetical protein
LSRCCAAFACGKLLRRLRLRQKASAWPPMSTSRYCHVRTFMIVFLRPVPRP